MNLTSWKNSPNGKILETDVVIAKNYLTKKELQNLELIVTAFLDLAERRALNNIPMTMEDWANRIDKYLLSDDLDALKDSGKISHEIAEEKALSEFENIDLFKIKNLNLILINFSLKKIIITSNYFRKYLLLWHHYKNSCTIKCNCFLFNLLFYFSKDNQAL